MEKEMPSVKKNILYNVAYQLLAISLPLITSPYISRVFGPALIGSYTYTNSIAAYFVSFSMLGISNYGIRKIAQAREDRLQLSRIFFEIYFLQLAFSLICTSLYVIFLFNYVSDELRIISICQGLYVLSAFFDVSWLFFGLEEFKVTVTRNMIVRIISVILVFTLVKSPDDLWIHTTIITGSILINQIILVCLAKRHVDFVLPDLKEALSHLKPIVLLFIPVLAVDLYILMDKIMLGYLSDMKQVGFYYNTEKIVNIPMGIIVAMGKVMLPRMSYIANQGDKAKTINIIEISMEVAIFLSVAMSFGIASISEIFAPMFFGKEFTYVGILSIAISPTIIIKSLANVIRNHYLIPHNLDKEYSLSVIWGAIVNIIFNWLLIPQYGALGAVIGTIAAELAVCIVQTIYLNKYLSVAHLLKNKLKYFIFGAIMYIVVHNLPDITSLSIVNILLRCLMGAVIYLGLCYFFAKNLFVNLKIKKEM